MPPGRPRSHTRPTISEVAAAAQVGRATAARALGDYGSVSPDARRRVEEAARRLGYRANSLARSMSTGTTRTIGIVVADIADPFFAAVTRGVSDELHETGGDDLHVLVVSTDEDPARERRAVDALVAKQVDGIIIAPAAGPGGRPGPHHLIEVAAETRLVLLDRLVPGLSADAVVLDNTEAGRRATEHLLAAGHRRIALVWGPRNDLAHDDEPWSERYRGYCEALAGAGLSVDPDLVTAIPDDLRADPAPALKVLLERDDRPTAVVTTESDATLALLLQLGRSGLRCPDEVSVVGIDDAPWAAVTAPPLTVYAQPALEMGRRAARLLVRRIAEPGAEAEIERLGGEFIERASVGGPPRI